MEYTAVYKGGGRGSIEHTGCLELAASGCDQVLLTCSQSCWDITGTFVLPLKLGVAHVF